MTLGRNVPHAPRIGDEVRRKEDLRLLLGQGNFSDDATMPGQAYAAIVRSPHAHARISVVNIDAARAMPGVLAVLDGAQARDDGLQPIPHSVSMGGGLDLALQNDAGAPALSRHWILPPDKTRFNGEAVAIVVAQTAAQAMDAAESVAIDYESLPFAVRASHASQSRSILHEELPSNIAIDGAVGDEGETDRAFAHAPHVVKLKTWVQRVTGVPMEPRAALAHYDTATGRYTLIAGSGNVVRQKRELATVLGVTEDRVRVIASDVGGNFGTRNAFYVEFALLAWASKKVGRPVKWACSRAEAFLSDYQGRDLEVEAELALDRDGNFLALRSTNTSNLGAYAVTFGPLMKGVELMTSVYKIPHARVRGRAVYSNTPPTNSYRSSGRPEAMFVIERLIDLAARLHGFDRVDLRRRNLIRRADLPFRNALGLTYDSGAYKQTMQQALKLGDWKTFEKRRKASKARGKLRGIAVANYIEIASGIPRERCEVTVDPKGIVEVVIGTLSSGQGHETSFAQLITDAFGVGIDRVTLVTGDTDRVSAGGGSHAGRSMRLAGVVIGKASANILDKARRIAARHFEVEAADLSFEEGRFRSVASNETLDIFEIARLSEQNSDWPEDLKGGLMAVCDEVSKAAAFPFGSHVCEVEIEPETGELTIVNYIAVDDVGRAVNPLILHGQAHGSITQGLGQALFEQCVYDADSGQLISGSFMDYAMPKAPMLPPYTTLISEIPATTNPLGIRAGGEGGTTPALAVLVNAAVDALRDYGVTHLEMPLTSAKIWQAMQAAPKPP